jgi:transcriptional regulator with GAF, ATPase, and Fis domain
MIYSTTSASSPVSVWVHSLCAESALWRHTVITRLEQAGVSIVPLDLHQPAGAGIVLLSEGTGEICNIIRLLSRNGMERLLVLAADGALLANHDAWQILPAGASDILIWSELSEPATVISAQLQRWREVDELIESPLVQNNLVGQSRVWKVVLRQIVEVARFTDAPILFMGETGTGKELAARLTHSLDLQRRKHDLVVLDCTTIVPELSGSELFGHERGAFTGATSAREGAFALANGGSLFLDEVGELGLDLQVQLLRVLQEHTYKRLGSNSWQTTDFRLICATNRDLLQEEALGHFRRDLYYRIASWTIWLPPLRERVEDILPLVYHFMREASAGKEPPELDEHVQEYFLTRDYPGNVRDLRSLVFRVVARHVGPGCITIGNIPIDERPPAAAGSTQGSDSMLEQAVQRMLTLGMGLKELRQIIDEVAIRTAIEHEDGNLQRAADKLGVTARTLQIRRAEQRHQFESVLNGHNGSV